MTRVECRRCEASGRLLHEWSGCPDCAGTGLVDGPPGPGGLAFAALVAALIVAALIVAAVVTLIVVAPRA